MNTGILPILGIYLSTVLFKDLELPTATELEALV